MLLATEIACHAVELDIGHKTPDMKHTETVVNSSFLRGGSCMSRSKGHFNKSHSWLAAVLVLPISLRRVPSIPRAKPVARTHCPDLD